MILHLNFFFTFDTLVLQFCLLTATEMLQTFILKGNYCQKTQQQDQKVATACI